MSILGTGFDYDLEYRDPSGVVQWTEKVHNLIPQEAVTFVAGAITDDVALKPNWYVGVFENDYAPSSSSSASQMVTPIGETTAYEAATRIAWQGVFDGIGRIDNSAVRAEFVFTANKTIYGGFLVSESAKQSLGGTLLSIARFPSPRVVETGGTLRVLAGIDLTPTV